MTLTAVMKLMNFNVNVSEFIMLMSTYTVHTTGCIIIVLNYIIISMSFTYTGKCCYVNVSVHVVRSEQCKENK